LSTRALWFSVAGHWQPQSFGARQPAASLRSLPTAAPRSGMVASVSSNDKAGHQTPAKAEYRLRFCTSSRSFQHGALEYKSANGKQACAFPGDRQLHDAPLPVTSPMRKQREELWAPLPPEYRKLLRLKAWHQSAGYSAPLHEKRLRTSRACSVIATGRGVWQKSSARALYRPFSGSPTAHFFRQEAKSAPWLSHNQFPVLPSETARL